MVIAEIKCKFVYLFCLINYCTQTFSWAVCHVFKILFKGK